jgi:glycosyltransferase involved in cell wall biosynthesis
MAHRADAIVCVSESERNLALSARIAPPEKLHVIHNGVRDVPLRAQPDAAPPRIVSLARLEPPKDPFTLLHALASLRSLDWQLDFIGGGPLEPETRALADRLGIASRIQWLGYQPDPAPLLARAQVFALSSRSEGFPRSVLEAMRAGLPVVASSVGGVPEAVSDGSTGFLVPPGDPAAFARALDAVLRDPAKRKLMGARGRQSYQARFLFDSMLQSTAGLYDRLVRTA